MTARHVFDDNPLEKSEKYAYTFHGTKNIQIRSVNKIYSSDDYDIAFFHVENSDVAVPDAVTLPFSKREPTLSENIYCYEYSTSRFKRTAQGGTHVSIEPLTHKGNIMRIFDSDYPETIPTPSFLTSFPALQGASGAPLLAGTENKNFYVAGMVVANQETHLLPAQTVKIKDGEKYIEETSYFLPLGKSINATLIASFLQKMGLELNFVE